MSLANPLNTKNMLCNFINQLRFYVQRKKQWKWDRDVRTVQVGTQLLLGFSFINIQKEYSCTVVP